MPPTKQPEFSRVQGIGLGSGASLGPYWVLAKEPSLRCHNRDL